MESTKGKFSGLEVLFEKPELPSWELPPMLEQLYGGHIGFEDSAIYANFVSTIDGVAALPETKDSPAIISGKSEADRFVMGILRALSDAVVIGAGTMRDAEGHLWAPDYIYPDLTEEFASLRRGLGKKLDPELIVVTGRGNIPENHPALEQEPLFVTTKAGAEVLAKQIPKASQVVTLTDGPRIQPADLQAFLVSQGFRHVLSEAGPGLFAQLLKAGLVDELFLTSSPLLAGRDEEMRPGIVNGLELLPDEKSSVHLLSARRSGSYLMLRYKLRYKLR
jgi:riboflavin biosynthesis pyrimidine reductase